VERISQDEASRKENALGASGFIALGARPKPIGHVPLVRNERIVSVAGLRTALKMGITTGLSPTYLHATTHAFRCTAPICVFFFAILFGFFASGSFAQKAADNQDLTADELAVNASSLYAQGKYAEAAKLYRKFVVDFGSAVEAQATVRQIRYLLAHPFANSNQLLCKADK
jgi:hypothetical protein